MLNSELYFFIVQNIFNFKVVIASSASEREYKVNNALVKNIVIV
jgi:hypothetical protein